MSLRPALLLALSLVPPARAGEPIHGFSYPVWNREEYAFPKALESLERLADTGAGWVVVIPSLYTPDLRSSVVQETGGTASDASLRVAIRAAKARGLKVLLKPHVDIPGPTLKPRALLSPADPDAWFAAYGDHLLRYAALAEAERCEMFAVGTELALLHMPQHDGRWRRLIAKVRAVYHGPLTFAANWHSVALVPFWDALDYIGVDAYYPVPGGDDVAVLRHNWRPYVAGLAALSKAWGKPVLFTEMGLSSQQGANLRPWIWWDIGPVSMTTQSAYLESMLQAFEPQPWFAGWLYWAWDPDPDSGGLNDKTMTVQGKPGLEVLKRSISRGKAPAPVPSRPDLAEAARRTWRALLGAVPGL